MPIREVMEAIDSVDVTARAKSAALRLEQALAAVSAASAGQTPSGAVQVDPGPRAESAIGETSAEAAQPSRAVARFEDVMRVAPSRAPIAQTPATAPVVPEVRPAGAPVDVTPAPVEEVPAVESLVEEPVAPAPVLSPVPAPVLAPVPAPAPEPAPAPDPVPEPEPLAARASVPPPKAAPFWFECLATVAPEAAEAAQAAAIEAERELHSIAPPGFYAEREEFVRPGTDTSRRTWVAALCLLLLAGVVVVLTGRAPRR